MSEPSYWTLLKTEPCGCRWFEGGWGEWQHRLCCSCQFGHPVGKHYHPVKGRPWDRITVDAMKVEVSGG